MTETPTALAEPGGPEPQASAPGAGAMLVFESVSKVYDPNVVALEGASFVIDKGEFVFLVGPSGSGKSTLIRLLLKEIEPTTGKIIIGGRDLGRLPHRKVPQLRRNIGCVFQDFKLLSDRTT
ncbi:MAG TPA: ATP-binding cassette domain-containing protein, partial [Gaiellaceae bacterium]|nr:ATP-binding cassette domain-containing protein [Gaiellaceae bacterium]